MISFCFFLVTSTIIFEPHDLVAASIRTRKIRLSCSNGHASIINCYWKRWSQNISSETQRIILQQPLVHDPIWPLSTSRFTSQLLRLTSNCRHVVVFMCKLSPRELLSANIANGNNGDSHLAFLTCMWSVVNLNVMSPWAPSPTSQVKGTRPPPIKIHIKMTVIW